MRTAIEETYRKGEIARAYDMCRMSLAEDPDDLWVRHRAVLCLIKSGAHDRAQDLFAHFRLAEARHDEDCLSVGARLYKARAFEADRESMPALAATAAEGYASVFERTAGHYPAINAAALYLLAGESGQSQVWARRVLAMRRRADPGERPEEAYYRNASEAEAHLLLGDVSAARLALAEAVSLDPVNRVAQATTRRQMRWICACLGLDAAVLDWPDQPRPAHYAGHIFDPDVLGPEACLALQHCLDEAVQAHTLGPFFGALAAGSDILIAETAIRHDRPLHIVLPVPVSVFVETSVRPFGRGWLRRMEQLLSAADEIVELTSDRRILSPANLNFASDVAMGMARMRADVLATDPVQLLICDPGSDGVPLPDFGTLRDRRIWREHDLQQIELPLNRGPAAGSATDTLGENGTFQSVMRAMLFADIANSSAVPDDRVEVFVREVLGRLVRSIDGLVRQPVYTDSWGDGLFLAFTEAAAAAEAAIALRACFAELDLASLGLPDTLDLRIGGHYGPVHIGLDPLQKRSSLFGGQVVVAARIERAAVPGSVFVSEPFAAVLTMDGHARLRCEYVGRIRIDRSLPDQPLYALRAIATDSIDAAGAARTASGLHAV